MPKRQVTYRAHVVVRMTPLDIPGLLDMLRYDAAQVTGWDSLPGDKVRVVMRSNTGFTPDRWRSFGLVLSDVETY